MLIAHEDSGVVDLMRGFFDARGISVEAHPDARAATQRLTAGGVDVVLVPWEGNLGRGIYRWILEHQRELREHVIVLRRDDGPTQPRSEGERRRVVMLDDLSTLLEVTLTIVSACRPRLLLVDDDPTQLVEMATLLEECGFAVTTTTSPTAAIATLQEHTFDVVLSDWSMPGGDGESILGWIHASRPDLLGRLVFMTGGDPRDAQRHARNTKVLPKGQDSPTLLRVLDRAITRPRLATGAPPLGVRTRPETRRGHSVSTTG